MNPFKRIIRAFKAKAAARKDSDFSVFVSSIPLTPKQLLIEECKKRDVSIYVDEPSEQSAGDYAIFRSVASEAELEGRLIAKKETVLLEHANVIAFSNFIAATIPLVGSIIARIKTFL